MEMTLPPNLNVYISAALFVLGAYVFALYLGLIVWTFRDIRNRSRDVLAQIMVTLLVAVLNVPGLLVYLLLRPHSTLAEEYERSLAEEAILQDLEERRVCPGCRRGVEPDFVICPYCHYQLHLRCVGCGRLLNPGWDVCPYCGLVREEESGADAGGRDAVAEPVALEVGESEQPGVDTLARYTRASERLESLKEEQGNST
jgi:RNA polymerase subunit RPABC4/transcription elongation factor Spt4